MLDNPRLSYLNDAQPQTDRAFVVYWMQQSQREHYNHALQYAIRQANDIGKPLVVYFGLTECYPSAGERHYRFMLEGLAKTQARLADRDIRMIIRRTDPAEGAAELAKDACFCVVDRGYLRHHIQWRRRAAESMDCPLHQVESDIVVPVQQASTKEEYAARTIRPKINRQVDDFLTRMQRSKVSRSSMDLKLDSFDISNVEEALQQLQIDRSVGPSPCFSGGNDQAEKHLRKFVDSKLNDYPSQSNDPSVDGLSNMSPYLHFGQISPIRIALAVRDKGGAGVEDYLEELIVRRELAINFVTYSRDYTSLKGLPDWAQRTLDKHRD
ncbi:MAG: deoxyribodipyrimidine photo-lyase, partial [Phycisphaerae bacterium]